MDHTTDDIASAPLPTAKTLRARTSLIAQFGRFLAINRRWRRSSARNIAERVTARADERYGVCVQQ
jgi:hypothetical protein